MIEPLWIMIVAGVASLAMVTIAALRAWNGWLELRRLEIEGGRGDGALSPSAAVRIEIAALRERVRKLEALAAGVEW